MMNCRRCGEILNANANFCWHCGANQSQSNAPDTQALPVVSIPEGLARGVHLGPKGSHGDELVMVTGLDAGTRFELVADGSSAGRDENCGILLNDVSVSRIHAEFSRTANGRIAVRDLNSLNGTYVNGARVESATLSSGDEVQIGKYKLVFWEASK
jgi:hypothetical protein